jgi:glutaredoxin
MAWFSFSFGRKSPARPKLPHLRVVMYTKQGCHLCHDAQRLLAAEQGAHGFKLQVVDVDTDPALAAQYGDQVPVVSVAGEVRFRGRVNRVLLERLLAAEAARESGRGRS